MVVRRVIRSSPFFRERDLSVTPEVASVAVKEIPVSLREGGSSEVEPVDPSDLARLVDISSAIIIHEAAADPHTGYQKESEKGAASGYASLNGSTKVVEDPANATATPAAGKIVIADGSGKVDSWVTSGAAAGTPSLRALGSTSTTACAGDDARLSDSRAPSGSAGGDLTGSYPNPTVGTNKVTLAQMAQVVTASFLGRSTAGTGNVEVLSVASAKTLLDLTGTNSGDQTITLTGDVTGSGTASFAATIANGAVTLAKMANMATASFLGRNTAGTGAPEVLSVATAKTLLNLTGTNSGDQTITLTGDVTGSGTSSFAATIANSAVTLAKMANVATSSFLGRVSAGAGAPEVLSVGSAKTLLNLTGTNSGDQTITLTGDVTGSGTASFAATIANNAVTLAKMATMATSSFLGRITAGTGNVEVLSVANAKTLLNLTGTNSGDQTITLTGDVTGSGTASFAATIANNAVTLAKMATMATASFLGRNTAGTGNVEVLSASTARSILAIDTTSMTLSNKTLNNTNQIQSAKGHRFWVFGSGANGGVQTSCPIPIGNFDSIAFPTGMMRACKVAQAVVSIIHYSGAPPATWTLQIYKNGSSASTMTFNLNGSPFTSQVTAGTPSALTFAAGDTYGFNVTGSSVDTPIVNVSVEFETTS